MANKHVYDQITVTGISLDLFFLGITQQIGPPFSHVNFLTLWCFVLLGTGPFGYTNVNLRTIFLEFLGTRMRTL